MGRGRVKGEFPQPRAKDQVGEGTAFSLALCFWTAEKPASHGSTMFIPAKIQPLSNITISTQLHQQKLPSDVFSHSYSHPSIPKPNEATINYRL